MGDGESVGRCEEVKNEKAEAVSKHALMTMGEVARYGVIWR